MDTIDFKQRMEWFKNNDEGREIATGWDFDVETVADKYAIVLLRDSQVREVIHKDGVATTIGADGVIRYSDRKFRNVRPPVPAPAACEHRTTSVGYMCNLCGKYVSPSPSVEAAQALKVAVAKLAERYFPEQSDFDSEWRAVLDGIVRVVDSYAAEQSAQRRAAGELARQASDHRTWTGVLAALAADAQARAGK